MESALIMRAVCGGLPKEKVVIVLLAWLVIVDAVPCVAAGRVSALQTEASGPDCHDSTNSRESILAPGQ